MPEAPLPNSSMTEYFPYKVSKGKGCIVSSIQSNQKELQPSENNTIPTIPSSFQIQILRLTGKRANQMPVNLQNSSACEYNDFQAEFSTDEHVSYKIGEDFEGQARLLTTQGQIGKGESNEQSGPIALRFHWLTLPKDYDSVPTSEIESEYSQLRRELLLLNDQAARNVDRISLKSVQKSKKVFDSLKVSELSGRESQNNHAIILRLRIELQQLQKRISSIELTGKEDIEGAILDTREQIASLRHKNKEIQQKSKEIGCSIEAGDEVFGDIKKLEVELSITERKKSKLEARWKEITDNLEKVRKNIGQLNGDAEQAENYIEEQIETSRVDKAQKKLEYIYRQHTYNLEALKKNQESIMSVKQQKYHHDLKQLDQLSAKIERLEQSINGSEERHLQQRAEIIELEQKLKVSIETAKQIKANSQQDHTIDSHEKENNKSVRIRDESTRKRSNLSQKLRKEELQGQNAKVTMEQTNKKIRLLNLRLNKSGNKKLEREKMSQTIDPSSLDNRPNIEKRAPSAFDQSNLSFQQYPKATPKLNTLDFSQVVEGTQLDQNQKTSNQHNDYSVQAEHIEEDIHESFLKEAEPELQLQPSPKAKTPSAKDEEEQISSKPLDLPSKNSLNMQEQQEDNDQDLIDFKKSIAAQLNGPYTGLKSIDIALDEIESTIRKHQSKSKLNRYTEQQAIDEQQEFGE